MILHGMGGTGPQIADGFIQAATDRGWLVVAPTFAYGDWQDPQQVAREDPTLAFQIVQVLDALPGQTGYRTRSRAMFFGFSRGAQLAHRFAFFYPERVRGVFALAAGTYTIPWLSDGKSRLNLPYGLGDADIERGHVILEINRERVQSVEEYRRFTDRVAPGDILTMYVYKPELNQRTLETVKLEER